MPTKPPLREFQRENVDWIRRVRRGLLADEPGLGKSRSALEGVRGAKRVLIVAPNLIMQSGVWDDEVELWGDDDTQYFTATYHDLNKRVKTGKTASSTKPVKVLQQGLKGHWDAVILDEAHYIKGRDSLWTWSAKQLARNCDMWMLLTGTPIPNWSHEVFTLMQTIYPEEGKIGNELGSFWRWAEKYFIVEPNPHNPRAKILQEMRGCTEACLLRDADDPCEHYLRFTEDNFGDHYMRHLRADHLDLPPIDFVDVDTPLDRATREMYRSLKKDFAANIDGHEILAWSQGAKNVMLDKMTTSPWLLHKEGEPHGGKLDRLGPYLALHEGPAFIVAHYRDSVEAIQRVCEREGKSARFIHGGTTDRSNAEAIRAFKSGRLDVLVGSLETVSEGLTLTIADSALFVERSYKPSRNTQATYRIYRLGQDKRCTITRLITPNSVDSGKEKLLKLKTDHQMRTLTAADFLRVA